MGPEKLLELRSRERRELRLEQRWEMGFERVPERPKEERFKELVVLGEEQVMPGQWQGEEAREEFQWRRFWEGFGREWRNERREMAEGGREVGSEMVGEIRLNKMRKREVKKMFGGWNRISIFLGFRPQRRRYLVGGIGFYIFLCFRLQRFYVLLLHVILSIVVVGTRIFKWSLGRWHLDHVDCLECRLLLLT